MEQSKIIKEICFKSNIIGILNFVILFIVYTTLSNVLFCSNINSINYTDIMSFSKESILVICMFLVVFIINIINSFKIISYKKDEIDFNNSFYEDKESLKVKNMLMNFPNSNFYTQAIFIILFVVVINIFGVSQYINIDNIFFKSLLIYIPFSFIYISITRLINKELVIKLLKDIKVKNEKYNFKYSYIKNGILDITPIFLSTYVLSMLMFSKVGINSICSTVIITVLSIYINILTVYMNLTYNQKMLNFLIGKFKDINKNLENDLLKDDITNSISVITNDEYGKLSTLYNELNDLTDKYINILKEKQEVIISQNKLVSIGELAGGVAHDINTPITAIKSGIDVLKSMNKNRTEEENNILTSMENSSNKIINIVNSMRNQIRNLGENKKVVFSIKEVLEDIKNIVTTHAIKNSTVINIEYLEDFKIKGNPTRLSQVITNLVLNAIEAYEKNKGKIDIVLTKAPGDFALIKITDYAGGLDDEITKGIFKKIVTTKGMLGTGFGLYLAYSIIKGDFAGDIKYDTKAGEGTTFYIILPLNNK